jgi:hypothetical protein
LGGHNKSIFGVLLRSWGSTLSNIENESAVHLKNTCTIHLSREDEPVYIVYIVSNISAALGKSQRIESALSRKPPRKPQAMTKTGLWAFPLAGVYRS